jgi:hypothetical protein
VRDDPPVVEQLAADSAVEHVQLDIEASEAGASDRRDPTEQAGIADVSVRDWLDVGLTGGLRARIVDEWERPGPARESGS